MSNFLIKGIFGLIFLVLVTPVGFVLRISGIDFMKRKIDPEASSYWTKRG